MFGVWKNKIRFLSNVQGNVAITFGLAASAIVGVGGGVIDYTKQSSAQTYLQGIADAAVLVGAKELQLSGTQNSKIAQIKAVTADFLLRNIKPELGTPVVNVNVAPNKGTVDLSVTGKVDTPFFGMLGMSSSSDVTAKAAARVLGGLPLCVLALEENQSKGISAANESQLTATGCSVHSNSVHKNSIEAWNTSLLDTGFTCSSGGAAGGGSNYSPVATTDCPTVSDPLSSRIAPIVSVCDYTSVDIIDVVRTLNPGVYCGGLKISGKADVTFSPGNYIIKDGSFVMSDQVTVRGQYVSFYFTGLDTSLIAQNKAEVSFSATKDGQNAGLLIYEDKNNPNPVVHEITSPNVKSLVGTIYLPQSQFNVSVTSAAGSSTAQESAFTVIIVKKLLISGKSNLVLNTDYAATDVPLPQSISNLSGEIVIAK